MFTPYLSREIYTDVSGEFGSDAFHTFRVRTNPHAPWIVERMVTTYWFGPDDEGVDYEWRAEVIL